jgi:hypothetical protein
VFTQISDRNFDFSGDGAGVGRNLLYIRSDSGFAQPSSISTQLALLTKIAVEKGKNKAKGKKTYRRFAQGLMRTVKSDADASAGLLMMPEFLSGNGNSDSLTQ